MLIALTPGAFRYLLALILAFRNSLAQTSAFRYSLAPQECSCMGQNVMSRANMGLDLLPFCSRTGLRASLRGFALCKLAVV